jgi:hypothetical protein
MLSRKLITFTALLIVLFVITSITASWGIRDDSEGETVIIKGIGYPPIKAESIAQARLMARRAAVIDAYRNALSMAGRERYEDGYFFSSLNGFVKGMTIIDEEYLKDGGVQITAEVPFENITVLSKNISEIPGGGKRHGLKKISVEEWYEIIKKLVTISE